MKKRKRILKNCRNKIVQKRPAPILGKITVQLSMLSIVISMKSATFFFKRFIFD